MKRKYFFDEYDDYLPMIKKQFQSKGYQFIEIDNHFCFIKDNKIYWHPLDQPLKDFILNANKRKQRAEYVKSKISPLRKRFNHKYLKIAKQVVAMQFRHAVIGDTIYLTGQFNTQYPLYVIVKNNNKFNVIQIDNLLVQQFKDTEYFQKVLDVVWDEYDVILKNKQLVKKQFVFNQEQLYNYFVNDCNMNFLYFKQLFGLSSNYQYTEYNYDKIHVFVKKDYNKIDCVDKTIKLANNILNRFNRIKNICIIFQNSLKQSQGIAYGNCVDNQFYDSVIIVTDLDPQYVILHQLGHLFQFKYLNNQKQKINQLYYWFVTNHQQFKYYDNQIFEKQEFVAQLFAQYYTYGYNKQFCQKMLFGKI